MDSVRPQVTEEEFESGTCGSGFEVNDVDDEEVVEEQVKGKQGMDAERKERPFGQENHQAHAGPAEAYSNGDRGARLNAPAVS